jgi:hypothetical protein
MVLANTAKQYVGVVLTIFVLTSLSAPVDAQSSPLPPASAGPLRLLLLGRVVTFPALQRGVSVTDAAPDEEVSDVESDVGVVVTASGDLSAFRLSSKDHLWTKRFDPPCGPPVIAGPHLYTDCEGRLRSFAVVDGASAVLDRGPDVDQVLVNGGYVAAHHVTGMVSVFERATQKAVTRKVLPELTTAPRGGELIVSPEVDGWCARGFIRNHGASQRWAFRLGCYDHHLTRLWSKSVSFDLPPEPNRSSNEPLFAIRQQGPCYFVANDQPFTFASDGRGKGLIVRWSRGQVEVFDDHTFATVETPRCERLTSPTALQALTRTVPPDPRQEAFQTRSALTASDAHRAFALIIDGATRLTGVDLTTQRVLFVTAVPLGAVRQKLDIIAGYPVIRTRFLGTAGQFWRASIHHPDTGRVLYEDERRVSAATARPSEN